MKVGDIIKCTDKDEAVRMTNELSSIGIYTDFSYENDGEQGLWLVIKQMKGKGKNEQTYLH